MSDAEAIQVRAATIHHVFNAIDPAPFRERDLDAKLEAFIVEWGREVPHNRPLSLAVRLERRVMDEDEEAILREAIREYFVARAASTRRRLKRLFHVGRISLVIGLAVVGAFSGLSRLVEDATLVRESLVIGGWVAMWRPLEIFLYEWWPIRDEARLFDRLAMMPVAVTYERGNTGV